MPDGLGIRLFATRRNTKLYQFTRKLGGGTGSVVLAEGKSVPFGFAIHDDHATGRFHHVSLGYVLGVGTNGDVTAVKQ